MSNFLDFKKDENAKLVKNNEQIWRYMIAEDSIIDLKTFPAQSELV